MDKYEAKIGKRIEDMSLEEFDRFWKIKYGEENPKDTCHYAYYLSEELGYLEYYKRWKKWVWHQNEDIIMSIKCLEEVIKKLKRLNGTKSS